MRILIQTVGSAGDVHPFVALGRALRQRGHEVALLANEAFAPTIEGEGLECVGIGTAAEFDRATENPDLWNPRKGAGLVIREGVLPSLAPTIRALTERLTSDTLLIGSTLGFAARIVQELHDVPLVTIHLAPSAFRSCERPPRLPGLVMPDWSPRLLKRAFWKLIDTLSDGFICPGLNEVRKDFGLPAVKRVFYGWVDSPRRVIGLFPDWFGTPQPDWPGQARTTGFLLFDRGEGPADADLDAWLGEGPAPVVFTHGSAQRHGHRFFAESAAAAERLGQRALLVTTNRDSVPRHLPPTIRHACYVPFSRLLPRAAAFVSHGGIGSCAQALAAGVPHLVAPMGFDQFDNGSRVADLRAGACLPAARYNARRAVAALRALLDADRAPCREAARRLRESDALEATCDLVEAASSG